MDVLSLCISFWAFPTVLITYIVCHVVSNLFICPLSRSRIPGPFVAKLTPKWLSYIDISGQRGHTVHNLHFKYGPVIQISPNEVSFCSPTAIDIIYNNQNVFLKAPWYSAMTRGGVFNMRDPAQHRQRRRLMTHAFSAQSVDGIEPCMRQQGQNLVRIIEGKLQDGRARVDMRHYLRMLAFDMATETFLGKSYGGLNFEEAPQYVKDLDIAFLNWEMQWRFGILARLLRKIPLLGVRNFFTADDRIYDYGKGRLEDYIRRYGRDSPRKDLLTKLIRRDKDTNDGLTDTQTAGEITNLTFAATDTTSMALLYLFWELAKNPTIQDKLRAELKAVPVERQGTVPWDKDMRHLPYLNGVINEALRVHTPAPSGLPRVVPKGGKIMDGYFVPEDTIVSVPSLTAHMNPTAFPRPQVFDPTRWTSTNGGTEEMKKFFIPFSRGTRACAGERMAYMDMRVGIASLVLKYEFRLGEGFRDEDMRWMDHTIKIPYGRCVLDITRAGE